MVEVQFAETGQFKKVAGKSLEFIMLQVQFHYLRDVQGKIKEVKREEPWEGKRTGVQKEDGEDERERKESEGSGNEILYFLSRGCSVPPFQTTE